MRELVKVFKAVADPNRLRIFKMLHDWRLVHFLGTLRDADGRILIRGFADAVVPPSAREQEALRRMPFDPVVATGLGLPPAAPEDGLAYFERLLFQPALNINGLTSGYQGRGSKTIVPHQASAKIDMRLVVNQDPDDIFEKFVAHAKAHGFDDLQIERRGGFYPSRTSLDHPLGAAAARAVRQGFGKEPILQPCMGGSDPDYYFTRVLGIPRVNVPYAPHDESNHAARPRPALCRFVHHPLSGKDHLYRSGQVGDRYIDDSALRSECLDIRQGKKEATLRLTDETGHR